MSLDHNPNISDYEAGLIQTIQDASRVPFDWDKPDQKLTDEEYEATLSKIKTYFTAKKDLFLGYQLNQDIHVPQFEQYLEYHINNIGDTYSEGNLRLSNKTMERAVVRFYSKLWNTPRPAPESEHVRTEHEEELDGNEAWGHILTMGCTEGNMYALRNARDYLKGKYSVPDFDHRGGQITDVNNPKQYHPKTKIRTSHGIRLSEEEHKAVQAKHKSYNHHEYGHLKKRDDHRHKKDDDHGTYFLFQHDINQTLGLEQHAVSSDGRHHDEKKGDHPHYHGHSKVHGHDHQTVVPHGKHHHHPHHRRQPGIRRASHKPRDPVIIYTDASHYSIGKIKDLLELDSPYDLSEKYGYSLDGKHLPEKIPVHDNGSMDLDVLVKVVKVVVEHDHPVILATNYGTTFTGGYDYPHKIYHLLNSHGLLHVDRWIQDEPGTALHHKDGGVIPVSEVYVRPNFWIHVDGALGGAYGSLFCEDDVKMRQQWADKFNIPLEDIPSLPCMDFRHNSDEIEFGPVMSIAMSGHKLLGAPMPTGIVMSLKKYILDYNVVSYIGSADTTMAGSRNGLSALVMWNQVAKCSIADYAKRFIDAEKVARYTENKLREAVPHVYRAKFALSVIFPRPDPSIIDKYSLSSDRYRFPGTDEIVDVVHIFCMPHVQPAVIDQLVEDLKVGKAVEDLKLE